LKPGPADPGRNRAGLKKKRRKEKPGVTRLTRRVDLVTRLTRQDPVANLLTFVFFFFTKTTSFCFFLKN
jgi:hypothetical protein